MDGQPYNQELQTLPLIAARGVSMQQLLGHLNFSGLSIRVCPKAVSFKAAVKLITWHQSRNICRDLAKVWQIRTVSCSSWQERASRLEPIINRDSCLDTVTMSKILSKSKPPQRQHLCTVARVLQFREYRCCFQIKSYSSGMKSVKLLAEIGNLP